MTVVEPCPVFTPSLPAVVRERVRLSAEYARLMASAPRHTLAGLEREIGVLNDAIVAEMRDRDQPLDECVVTVAFPGPQCYLVEFCYGQEDGADDFVQIRPITQVAG